MEIVEVNGVKYELIEKKQRKVSPTIVKMLGIATMHSACFPYATKRKRNQTPNVDIVEEYGLIQKKKSKLSRADRDFVVWKFERNFRRIG